MVKTTFSNRTTRLGTVLTVLTWTLLTWSMAPCWGKRIPNFHRASFIRRQRREGGTTTNGIVIDSTKEAIGTKKIWPYARDFDLLSLSQSSILQEVSRMNLAVDALSKRHGNNKNNAQNNDVVKEEISTIRNLWMKHCTPHLTNHLKFKEDHAYPDLNRRLNQFPMGQLKRGNASIRQSMNTVTSQIQSLDDTNNNNNNKNVLKKSSKLLKNFHQELSKHFSNERDEILPKVRNVYEAKEWGMIMRKMSVENGIDNGCVVDYMGGEKNFRKKFLKPRGIPGIAYTMVYGKDYSKYQKNVLNKMEKLMMA